MFTSEKKSSNILTVIRNLSITKKSKDILQNRTILTSLSTILDWNDNANTPERPSVHYDRAVATDIDCIQNSKRFNSPEFQCCTPNTVSNETPRSRSLPCNVISGRVSSTDIIESSLGGLECKLNSLSLLEMSIAQCDSTFLGAANQATMETANNRNSLSEKSQRSYHPKHNSPVIDTSSEDAFESLLNKLKLQDRKSSFPLSNGSSFIVSSSDAVSDDAEKVDTETFYHQIHNSLDRHGKVWSQPCRRVASLRWSSSDSSGDADQNEVVENVLIIPEVDLKKSLDQRRSRRIDRDHRKADTTRVRNVAEPQQANNKSKPEINVPSERRHDEFIYSLYPVEDNDGIYQKENRLPRHPSAERYTKRFKANRVDLTTRLLSLFNKSIFSDSLPDYLELVWNPRLRKTAGLCKYLKRKVIPVHGETTMQRSARIELSTKVCTTAERLRDTLLHEACHAAVWILDGVHEHHGHHWKQWAHRAKVAWPRLPMVLRCHTYKIDTQFTYQCLSCSAKINRHSKSIDITKQVCSLCHGRFELIRNRPQAAGRSGPNAPTTSISHNPANNQLPAAGCSTPRTPAFAEFVRHQYRSVRDKRQQLAQPAAGKSVHAEVMTELASLFREFKLDPTRLPPQLPVHQEGTGR